MNPSNPETPGVPFPGDNQVFNLLGFFRTQESVPTDKPVRFAEQLVIVTSGGSSRQYIYDTNGLAWRYTTLT